MIRQMECVSWKEEGDISDRGKRGNWEPCVWGGIEKRRLAAGFEILYEAIKQARLTREPEGGRRAKEQIK